MFIYHRVNQPLNHPFCWHTININQTHTISTHSDKITGGLGPQEVFYSYLCHIQLQRGDALSPNTMPQHKGHGQPPSKVEL